MMKKALAVLTACILIRFDDLKQIDPVGKKGKLLIYYSISFAFKYVFNKVVFFIKEENYEMFKNSIGSRLKDLKKYIIEEIIEGIYPNKLWLSDKLM